MDRLPGGRVGVRAAGEVEAAIARLSGSRRPLPAPLRGALATYEWAAGRRLVAPVSGAQSGRVPTEAQLAGEERVALRRVHDRAGVGLAERDFALGAVRALAWILGYTGDQP
ncbi:hypothetical protein GCM10018781_61110 [Kitasatospora indigofera]|uniref:Uncharacterized protein n=1 Tax=Kitasatospora indigofera TaxID=67307 RepID=A0A919GAK5_9ACTN|nr:hypothetical protein [Kitasatospora indigofera]GHH80491.1 hypothetical protein GCM10018781_61110 [Kitasatospora indigofera]